MSYNLTYVVTFTNNITENIVVELYHKDVVPSQVNTIKGLYCNKKYLNGEGDKFDTIISSELNFGIFLTNNDSATQFDFLVSFHDEWKVILKNDSQVDFVGFLVPNECTSSLRDKPVELELTATDTLGYLKTILLKDANGNKFTTENTLLEYLKDCLLQTALNLNIRIYCNIYHTGMNDRNAVPSADMFTQTYVDYRTFQTDATTFDNCYNVLSNLLTEGFSLFQWFGRWTIIRLGEMQGSIGPKNWYTEYDYTGSVVEAKQELTSAAQIAKQQILSPVNADQTILSKFSVKSAKHTYTYDVWPELPKNNKFERGSVIFGLGGYNPADQTTSVAYTIDDWQYGLVNEFDLPNLTMTASTQRFYRLSTYNIYGVEVQREVIGEAYNTDGTHQFWLKSETLPVNAGDKISIGISAKSDRNFNSGGSFTLPIGVTLFGNDGNIYMLDSSNGSGGLTYGIWKKATISVGPRIELFYASGQDTTDWNSINIDSLSIPVGGNIYIIFQASGPISNTGPRWHFKDFSLDYHAFIAGGYVPVKGDYWITSQNQNYQDIIEKDVFISDAPNKVFKGALLKSDHSLTGRAWHRLNITENKDFKELVNIGRYNGAYRRTWQVSGTFRGTMYHPASNETIRMPLGFHRHFFFPNTSMLNGYYFQLVPPLEIDYVRGEINATLVDCYHDGGTDGNNLGDTHQFQYNF